jgi:isopentenyl diphosphate isomerase/L-lactate dehydrogenase-like FMN-dependent dehydrogenase
LNVRGDCSAGCFVLNAGQESFHRSTIGTVDYVEGQGNLTVDNLRNFAGSLAAAKNIGVDNIFLPVDVQQKIDIVEEKLNSSANEFSARIVQNSDKFKTVMDKMCVHIYGFIRLTLHVLNLNAVVM